MQKHRPRKAPTMGKKIAAPAADHQIGSSNLPNEPHLGGRRQYSRGHLPNFAGPAPKKAGHWKELRPYPYLEWLIIKSVKPRRPGGDGNACPWKFSLEKTGLGQNDACVSRVEHGVGIDNEYVRGRPRIRSPILPKKFSKRKLEMLENRDFRLGSIVSFRRDQRIDGA